MNAQRITQDTVDRLQESLSLREASPEQLRERAETEYRWATDADAFDLDPGLEKAYLLSVAADDFLSAGDRDRALEVAREAQASAPPGSFTAHPTLVSVHLGRDDLDSAQAVADEARAAAAADPAIAEMIGDAFELGDRPAQAERWYAIGLRGVDPGEGRFWYERLLRDRYRVRRDQDKAPDVLDLEYENLDRMLHGE